MSKEKSSSSSKEEPQKKDEKSPSLETAFNEIKASFFKFFESSSPDTSSRNTSENLKHKNELLFIFHVNHFSDGNGDLGNLIDINNYFIKKLNQLGAPKIRCIYIIGYDYSVLKPVKADEILSLEKLKKRLQEEALQVIPDEDIYFLTNGTELDNLIQEKNLTPFYQNADQIYEIATTFGGEDAKLKQILNKKYHDKCITITEHYASSFSMSDTVSKPPFHYATGVGKGYTGYRTHQIKNDLTAAQMLIQFDGDYLAKLGLQKTTLTESEAQKFLEENLIIPVYLAPRQEKYFKKIQEYILNSPLGKSYKKVYFHVNKPQLLNDTSIHYFFKDKKQLTFLYLLYSGISVAVVAGDNMLELALSCGLLPLYLPPSWKRTGRGNFYSLCCDKNSPLEISNIVYDFASNISQEKSFFGYKNLTKENIMEWKQVCLPGILSESFEAILDKIIFSVFFKKFIKTQKTEQEINTLLKHQIHRNTDNSEWYWPFIAIMDDNLAIIKEWVIQGGDVNLAIEIEPIACTDPATYQISHDYPQKMTFNDKQKPYSLIDAAIECRKLDIIKYLLEQGAEFKLLNSFIKLIREDNLDELKNNTIIQEIASLLVQSVSKETIQKEFNIEPQGSIRSIYLLLWAIPSEKGESNIQKLERLGLPLAANQLKNYEQRQQNYIVPPSKNFS